MRIRTIVHLDGRKVYRAPNSIYYINKKTNLLVANYDV